MVFPLVLPIKEIKDTHNKRLKATGGNVLSFSPSAGCPGRLSLIVGGVIMSWENDVISAAKRQQQLNDRAAEYKAKLKSAVDKACPIIANYCKKFKAAGADVTYDFEYDSFTVSIRAAGIKGGISGGIQYPASYFGSSELALVVKCYAHGGEKEFVYRGDICDNDVIEWIKYATREKSIFDLFREL